MWRAQRQMAGAVSGLLEPGTPCREHDRREVTRPRRRPERGGRSLAWVTSPRSLPPGCATGFAEFDRVLGGGLVPGSVVLLGAAIRGSANRRCCSRSRRGCQTELNVRATPRGEESLRPGRSDRARRIGMPNTELRAAGGHVAGRTSWRRQSQHQSPQFWSSIRSRRWSVSDALSSAPGSVAQLQANVSGKSCSSRNRRDVAVFLVGHVTKEGAIAGPRVVEHMVDTVLYFEKRSVESLHRRSCSQESIWGKQRDGRASR